MLAPRENDKQAVMKWHFILCLILLLSCSSPIYARDEKSNSEGGEWCWKDYVTVGILGGTAAVVAAPFVVTAAGFTTGGVAAGSIAAGIQSSVYGGYVGATSAFAVLQSFGAAGIGMIPSAGIFTAGAGVTTWLKTKVAPCDKGPKCSSDQE